MNTMPSRVAPWFLLAALSAVSAEYHEAGSTVVLRPETKSGPITGITWKCNGDIVAEWIKDKLDLEYYGRFKNHATLDMSTAILTLSRIQINHNGVYTVEINFQKSNESYDINILNPLQKPQISVQPLACGHESKSCILVCESDVTDVGSVTYSWWKDGKDQVTEMSENRLNIINDEETQRVEHYSCKIKNPIKELESEKHKNPFYIHPPFPTVIVIVVVLIIILGVAAFFAWMKRDTIRSVCGPGERSAQPPTHNGAGHPEGQPLSEVRKSP